MSQYFGKAMFGLLAATFSASCAANSSGVTTGADMADQRCVKPTSPPLVTVMPKSINFREVDVDAQTGSDVYLQNNTPDEVRMTRIEISGDTAFGISRAPDLPTKLRPGGLAFFNVGFQPKEARKYETCVLITFEPSPNAVIPLLGSGTHF